MKNTKKITYWVIVLAFQIIDMNTGQVAAHDRSDRAGIVIVVADTIPNHVISYSSQTMQPVRLMFDYYHHSLPSTKVGNRIITGSLVDDN